MALIAVVTTVWVIAPARSASAEPRSADIATSMRGPARFPFHGYLPYTITVINNGPNAASGVVVTDVLPYNATFSRVSTSRGSCTSPLVGGHGTVTCTTGSLQPGVSMTINLTVYIKMLFHNQTVFDVASAASNTPDPNPNNNAASVLTIGI